MGLKQTWKYSAGKFHRSLCRIKVHNTSHIYRGIYHWIIENVQNQISNNRWSCIRLSPITAGSFANIHALFLNRWSNIYRLKGISTNKSLLIYVVVHQTFFLSVFSWNLSARRKRKTGRTKNYHVHFWRHHDFTTVPSTVWCII